MLYPVEQRQILESMGLRLYVRIPAVQPEVIAHDQADEAFWQTRLGLNIQRMAQGRDVTAMPVSPAVGKSLAKRMLWQQLRPLLKPE
jgi:DNA polymerase III psi subunit